MAVLHVLKQVFGQVRYVVLAVVTMVTVFSASLLLPNLGAITHVYGSENISLGTKLYFLLSLHGSIATNFTFYSALNLVLISVLFGVNIALLVYYIRRRQTNVKGVTAQITSAGGLISGLFGVGCAACGSVILTAILGIFGASAFLVYLPFHGAEFGFLGIFLLLFSIYYLLKKIADPLVCPVR